LSAGGRGRRAESARDAARWGACTTAIALLVVILSAGCSNWRGFGFSASGPEMPRLKHVLALKPGMSVADVGAGTGQVTLALAVEVGPTGRVFSTELDPNALEQIRAAVSAARLTNVTLVQAQAGETSLPTECCDAVLLRRVYHHLSDPAATNASLLRALRPGGLLAVIDFPPTLARLWRWPPKGVPQNRGGHGIAAQLVVEEVTASGFEFVQVIDDWPGRSLLANYCAVFRKSPDGHGRRGAR